jgi:hypothetical protein
MSEQPLERSQDAIDDAREAVQQVPGLPPDDDAPDEPMTSPGTSPKPDADDGDRVGDDTDRIDRD